MQIEKHQHCGTPLFCSVTGRDASMAHEHSALFPARLALVRWMRGGETPHVHTPTHQLPRAAWFAQAQRNFQAWLDAGGFHQHDEEHASGSD
ncbi:hypothetical protein HH212_13370 [Massilia forsythiae]|uniref:Uncharacterized protein n=1 Tax=Massilia forsythiae TaxID=2728020 RepID=A0A7Z2VXU3_9BURK|nr:hypothetical protein [Massilia forsythiae]QJE00890.1 hypothetical protein HH212_13370 [Massilia forsythiae]